MFSKGRKFRWSLSRSFILISMICSLLTNEARGQTDTFSALGRQIVRLVKEHFYDASRAEMWASRHADYAVHTDSLMAFASLTKNALSELNTSHTDFYTALEPDYYALLSIFHEALGVERVEWESIGADFTRDHFVRVIFAGGPADTAGLHRGDRVVMADDKAFDPIASFRGKNGNRVILTVERKPGQPTIDVPVIPRKVDPKKEWVEAQRAGSRIIERAGKKIAYAPMFSCAGDEYVEELREAISQKFQETTALILDLRDGWGGCAPDFVNVFSSLPPIPVYTDRSGKQRKTDAQWRKPLYILINGGTRSGKEEFAFAVKKHQLGILIGERTAGAVMGGRCFLLLDKSLLYIAELDVTVDGQRLEGRGVLPDVEVSGAPPFADGFDPQLEKALEMAAH